MAARYIVRGQRVDAAKAAAARTLRSRMTPEEELVWQAVRREQLDGLKLRRQQVIAGCIVDFYCHAAALAIEIDGPIHDEQPEYDAERTTILGALGIAVLRITNDEVHRNIAAVLRCIAATARARIAAQPVTLAEGC